jgi:hypothetical protein
MRLVNKFGLPEAIVEAVRRDPYNSGGAELTASSMSTPPQIRALWREHADEIEVDVVDEIWKLLGQSIHVILERAGRSEIREKRLHAKIAGAHISAQLDTVTYVLGKITEWKLTSVWVVVYGGRSDWIPQMNVQAEVLDRNGREPRELEVVAILRDWSKKRAGEAEAVNRQAGYVKDGYPLHPVAIFGIPLWEKERRESYIAERVRLNRAAALGDVLECTDEERWIRKKGDKPTRCLEWCSVNRWCPTHARYLETLAAKKKGRSV